MATLQVLLIDDDPRMEALLRDQVGLPTARLVRDPAGIFEPEPAKHGLVLLNAEFQKSFGLCRRFKKKRETASVPVAFFTLSHEREHLRILAEHRALPTHADHYLLPPVTRERVLDLLTKTIGEFVAAAPDPVRTPRAAEVPVVVPAADPVDGLDPDVIDFGDADFGDGTPHEATHEDVVAPPVFAKAPASPVPVSAPDDEFVAVASAAHDDVDVPPPPSVLGEFDPFPQDAPISQGEASLGGFQADRMTSVERYVSKLHGEFVRMEDQIEAGRAEREAERARLLAERDAALVEAQRATALAEENRRLADQLRVERARSVDAGELERVASELATLRGEVEWARAEGERSQAELRRLRGEVERLLGESDRARSEAERARTELVAAIERTRSAEAALAELKATAHADSTRLGAQAASLEARVSRAAHRLAAIGETLHVARPSLVALIDLARELDLEEPADADGVPPGFDDR